MRGWQWLLPVALVASACSTPDTTPASSRSSATPSSIASAAGSPAVSPSAPAIHSTVAVLVDLLSDPTTYTMTLVGADGQIVKQLRARQRTPIAAAAGHAITLPYVSTTEDSLYYVDGDTTVRSLRLDGTSGQVMDLGVGPGEEAAFAVGLGQVPGFAVSVLDFNKSPVHVTLYTDTVPGGSRHVIYESDSNYVWPAGYRAGSIVLAHAYGPYEEDVAKAAPGRDNPYSAISYHLVNPLNGDRYVLIGACTVSGPPTLAGSGCIQGGSIDWQGNTASWSTYDWGTISAAAAISPEGDWMAATRPDTQTQMGIWRRDGAVTNWVDGPGPRDWAGWLDDQTLVVGSYLDPTWRPEIVNVVQGGLVHRISAHGFFAATLPTSVT